MQQLPTWLKTGVLKSTAFGTALSITLQLTCCYAVAYANTEDEASSNVDSQPAAASKFLGGWHHKKHARKSSQGNEAEAALIPENVLLAKGHQEDSTSIALGGLEAVPPANLPEESKSSATTAAVAQPSESG